MKTTLFLLLAIMAMAQISALACLGPMSETRTFLIDLPDDADAKNVIGKVIILEQTINDKTHETLNKVKVITALRGLKKGQTLTVAVQNHSCARDIDVKPEQTFYIAGNIDENGIFYGEWRGLLPNILQGKNTK